MGSQENSLHKWKARHLLLMTSYAHYGPPWGLDLQQHASQMQPKSIIQCCQRPFYWDPNFNRAQPDTAYMSKWLANHENEVVTNTVSLLCVIHDAVGKYDNWVMKERLVVHIWWSYISYKFSGDEKKRSSRMWTH